MSNSLLLLLFYFSLKGWVREGTHTHTHTSVGLPAWVSTRPAACQSLMDQQQDQHARRPREPTCVWSSSLLLFALFLPISCLIFFCMNSSLACSDILIPQPNLPHPNHTHTHTTYLSPRTHQKLVQSFLPSHYFPSYFPFPFFNNQGHSNNCRVGWRGR